RADAVVALAGHARSRRRLDAHELELAPQPRRFGDRRGPLAFRVTRRRDGFAKLLLAGVDAAGQASFELLARSLLVGRARFRLGETGAQLIHLGEQLEDPQIALRGRIRQLDALEPRALELGAQACRLRDRGVAPVLGLANGAQRALQLLPSRRRAAGKARLEL